MHHSRRRPPAALSPVTITNNNHSTRPSRQSTRNVVPSVSSCHGCSQPMYNPTLVNVLDHSWHPECVRCFVCRCSLNEKCYSREGKLYCKDDFVKKYIHRCFACQNLLQSTEMIRRIRPGRLYHADCFACSKCKQKLQDDDISAVFNTVGSNFNDVECVCQACLNPNKTIEKPTVLNGETVNDEKPNDENQIKVEESATPPTTNGISISKPLEEPKDEKEAPINDDQDSMEVDETNNKKVSPVKESPTPMNMSSVPEPMNTPMKNGNRHSKARQSTSSNGNKRSPTKAKATPPSSRQKETPKSERKGRSPTKRSKAQTASQSSSVGSRRSSGRRTAKKPNRYGKRRYASGSEDEESDDDDEEDVDDEDHQSDMTNEDEMEFNGRETKSSPAPNKTKSTESQSKEKVESDNPSPQISVPPTPPNNSNGAPSLLSQTKMSEPLSLLSGLASNPMSISSIMKPDAVPSFMPPNFNPAFHNPAQFLPPNHPFPPGFPLSHRLPMPMHPSGLAPPPPPVPSASTTQQAQTTSNSNSVTNQTGSSAPSTEKNRPSQSALDDESDNESVDDSPNSSQMDVSVNAEPGTPARPPGSPKGARTTTNPPKPSALTSLLEFGKLPPSSLPEIRSNGTPPTASPFPFPFVNPGPGVPFPPQNGSPMAAFYRPPFGMPPTSSLPLDMSQPTTNGSKKKSTLNNDGPSSPGQNPLAESSSPKKKPRKSNANSRGKGKGKGKKNETDYENGDDDDHLSSSSSPAPSSSSASKKKKMKGEPVDNGNSTNEDEKTKPNGTGHPHPHNILAQMSLLNNSFMPPGANPGNPTNGKTSPAANAQQAQLAAMYGMAPHFAAYNPFPGAFNPAFAAAAYANGYPNPFGFHPAFSGGAGGQPFPFMPPMNNSANSEEKSPNPTGNKSKSKTNGTGEKKKPAAGRMSKKKSIVANDSSMLSEMDATGLGPSAESISQMAATPDSNSTPSRRRTSGTESDDYDEHGANGKNGYDSDGSVDRPANMSQSVSSNGGEKRGGRTTIKPQQLEILCRAFESCSKPNKAQREQLIAETGLNQRVIQVWFQNKRSKERKGGKIHDRKGAMIDDGEDEESRQSNGPDLHIAESLTNNGIES